MAEKFLLCVLLAYFSIYICIPICSSAFNQDSDNELNKQIGSSLPCFEKYITESYFRHHKSLVDPNFREFVIHNVPLDSEKVCPRLLDLDRHLIGEGSHRSLSSFVKFSIQPDMISELNSWLCEFIIVERLPLGVFADSFELEHMLQQRVFNDVSVFGDINLELPSFLSNRSVVEVHLDIDLNKTSGQDIVQFKIELPLHARYPRLDENGYSKVIFNIPDLFLRCKSREVSAAQSCVLTRLSGDPKLDPVVWLIPAGIKAHARLVCLGTFASALLSAITIIFVSLKQSRSVSGPILKQT